MAPSASVPACPSPVALTPRSPSPDIADRRPSESSTPRARGLSIAGAREAPSLATFPLSGRSYRRDNTQNLSSFRRRANSTSSIYLKSTMQSPNSSEAIRAVALVIVDRLRQDKPVNELDLVVLSEFELEPKRLGVSRERVIAGCDLETVNRFIARVYTRGKLSDECSIMALIYVERMLCNTGLHLTPFNWRHVLMGAMMLASKVWDDLSMINDDFCVVCPMFSLQEVNALELNYLEHLNFTVTVSAREYAEQYFRLLAIYEDWKSIVPSSPRAALRNFTLKPLSKVAAQRLEIVSADSEQVVREAVRKAAPRKRTDFSPAMPTPLAVIS